MYGVRGTINTVEKRMIKKVDCAACKICGFYKTFDNLGQIDDVKLAFLQLKTEFSNDF
jgi:fumarylacetoacetate (FAA) hydrolase family protein